MKNTITQVKSFYEDTLGALGLRTECDGVLLPCRVTWYR